MSDEIAGKKDCEHCGKRADPVHHYSAVNSAPVFRGWFCPSCGHFDKSVYREKKLDTEDKP